jgi:hypothetical protein
VTTVYIDPQTIHNPAAGIKPPATWGDTVRDNQTAFAAPPAVKAQRSSDQTGIVTATWTPVAFDATDAYDTDAFHDVSTNNTRITVPSGLGGRYHLIGNFPWDSNTAGTYRQLAVRLNGTTFLASCNQTPAGYDRQVVSVDADLSATDYVELCVYHDSGSNRSSGITTPALCWFSARLVGWA